MEIDLVSKGNKKLYWPIKNRISAQSRKLGVNNRVPTGEYSKGNNNLTYMVEKS